MKKDAVAAENHFVFKCESCAKDLRVPFWCDACLSLQDYKPVSSFEALGVCADFPLNTYEVEGAYKAGQVLVHPDLFQDVEDQKKASYWSSALNKAYQDLKDPLKTLRALLESRHLNINEMSPEALAEAFELQEEIADASYNRLKTEILPDLQKKWEAFYQEVCSLYLRQDWSALAMTYVRWNQIHRLIETIKDRC